MPTDCAAAKAALISQFDNDVATIFVRYWTALNSLRNRICADAQAIADLRVQKPDLAVSVECDGALKRLCQRLTDYLNLVAQQECDALNAFYNAVDLIDCNAVGWQAKYVTALQRMEDYRELYRELHDEFRWAQKSYEFLKSEGGKCGLYYLLQDLKVVPPVGPPPPSPPPVGPPPPPVPLAAARPCECGG
jgi:hypothetical protein